MDNDETVRVPVIEMDFTEVEMRVLAHMREDAENMDDTDSFRRPEDLKGFDTCKVRQLLTLQEAKTILRDGVVKSLDIHKRRAAEIFDVPEDEVTEEQRRFAKSYNFKDMYTGPSPFLDRMVDEALSTARKRLNES